jgi:hypothetical protein
LTLKACHAILLVMEVSMSDGPYKSLKMPSGWRGVAKLAELDASSPDEITQALHKALAEEFSTGIPPQLISDLRKVLGDGSQSSLDFNEPDRFAGIRAGGVSSPRAALLVDNAAKVFNEGTRGPEALREAVRRTLIELAFQGARQAGEHYYREFEAGRASEVLKRIDETVPRVDFAKLTDLVLGTTSTSSRQSLPKRTGLDDGPRL